MIVFKGTKKVGFQSFLIFGNENGSFIDVPVDDNVCAMFLLYFDRLAPANVPVETAAWSGSED